MSVVTCLNAVGTSLTRVVVSLPVILVVLLIAADWYSFTIDYAILHNGEHGHPVLVAILTAVFNLLLALTLWCYYKTVKTSSSVRDNPPPADYYTRYRQHHPDQPIRVCASPWVANCVGFKNYKFFVLFLLYATLSCLLYQVAGISLVIAIFSDHLLDASLLSLLCALITAAFAFALAFFSLFHISLVLSGQTTIEVHAQRTGHVQRAGAGGADTPSEGAAAAGGGSGSWQENWTAVFGSSWSSWLLPVDSASMTGYEFDFDDDEDEDIEQGLIATRREVLGAGSGVKSNGHAAAGAAAGAVRERRVDLELDDGDDSRSNSDERSKSMSELMASLSPLQAHDLRNELERKEVENDDDV